MNLPVIKWDPDCNVTVLFDCLKSFQAVIDCKRKQAYESC